MSPPANTVRPFKNGVYCPLVTPFGANEEIDFKAFQKQVLRLAKAKMGLVILGTNGEASHLSDDERTSLIKSAREALDSNGFNQVPLLVGTGSGSAHHTVKLCHQAKAAGADYCIVISPGYFSKIIGRDREALESFYIRVLDQSPLPVMIYNFPSAAGGIDLDSDMLIKFSDHQNCFGAKLTCANIGKGTRLALYTQSEDYLSRHVPYQIFLGFSDYLLPALVSGHTGCITGTANVIPKTIVKLYETSIAALASGDPKKMEEARKLQDLISETDWIIVKAGIGGTKYAMNRFIESGLGGVPRKPLPLASEAVQSMVDKGIKNAIEYENSLI